jgi:hypothetical protein
MSGTENLDGIGADGLRSELKFSREKIFICGNSEFLTYAEVREVEGYFNGSEPKPGEDAS